MATGAAQRGGLAGIGQRQDHFAEAALLGEVGDGQGAADGAHRAVESQLTAVQPSVEDFVGDLTEGGQEGQGDGEIEVIAFLA